MTDALKVGIVGTGWVANQHLIGYETELNGRVKVVAACDPRTEALTDIADRYGIGGRYSDALQMFEEESLDVVVLLTPPAIRDEIIYPAIDRGLDILVEKPFATSGAKAVEYVEAAEAGGVQLAVSQNFRWFSEYQWLASRLAEADVGVINYFEARCFQNRPQATGQWRAAESKLEMAIFSVHLIDRLQWLAPGIPVMVNAITRKGDASDLPGEQFTVLTVQFDDGAVAHMTSSWKSRALPITDLRVDTSVGSAHVSRAHPMSGDAHARADFGRSESQLFAEVDGAEGPKTYGRSMRAFVDAIETGTTAPHSGRDNLRTMGIMEAAYLSAARDGEPVSITEALGVDLAAASVPTNSAP
jgi:predicted dehydrogenase